MNYQNDQQQYIQFLEKSINAHGSSQPNTKVLLVALVDSLPAYGATALNEAMYGTFANILAMKLPNNRIQQQPGKSGMCSTAFQYTGPYSGYQNAFYPSVTLSSAASMAMQQVAAVNSSLNASWWGNYGVAILTDAVYSSNINISLDTQKLSGDLSSYNKSFLPCLTAAYTAVISLGYSPTASVMNSISQAGQQSQVAALLEQSILDGEFTANINGSIAAGGDKAVTATWFEFNLWVTLQALGVADVNSFIQQANNAGLIVPISIGPNYWWNGGYTYWYTALSGTDVLPLAAATISSGFPQKSEVICSRGGHTSPQYGNTPNGYCLSLCEWGSLNWYLPGNGSCFGKQTGVLMADGSVKTIDKIVTGDMVHSNQGPRKVVLVESPQRGNRTLYQLNRDQVFATAAHPFRSASSDGPLRYAVKPWEVLDNLPTMIEKGVGQLQSGVGLRAWDGSQEISHLVQNIYPQTAGSASPEKVYDLILENWERGQVNYYVGGPEKFYAVDAETVDPTYHLPTTAGILTAMHISLPVCRQLLSDPARELPALMARLNPAMLRGAMQEQSEDKPERISIPGPDYYKQNGEWCPHASALEFHLVKYFGTVLRRESSTGWRASAAPPSTGNQLAITLHDLILLGEHSIPAHSPLTISLQYIGWGASMSSSIKLDLPAQATPQWFCKIDQVISAGEITSGTLSGKLAGNIYAGENLFGRFTVACIDLTTAGHTARLFVYDENGDVIGRIALELCRVLPGSLSMAAAASASWSNQQAMGSAIKIGKRIGEELVMLMQRNFT